MFSGKTLRSGTDTAQFTPVRDEVKVGLENLVLGPGLLQLDRRRDLLDLMPDGAPAGPRHLRLAEEHRELHGDRAGSPSAAAENMVDRRDPQRGPVHAAMRVEASVLRAEHRLPKRGRHLLDAHPGQTPLPEVDAHLVQDLTVAVEQVGLGRPPGAADLRIGRHGLGWRRRDCEDCHQPEGR